MKAWIAVNDLNKLGSALLLNQWGLLIGTLNLLNRLGTGKKLQRKYQYSVNLIAWLMVALGHLTNLQPIFINLFSCEVALANSWRRNLAFFPSK